MLSNPYSNVGGLARLSPWRLVVYGAWCLQGFALSWIKTRRFMDLLAGVPAVLTAVFLLNMDARSDASLDFEMQQKYLASLANVVDAAVTTDDAATRDEKIKQAEFYLDRLELARVQSEEFRWQRSRLDALTGRTLRRWEDLQAILRDHEQIRNAEAHLEIAHGLLTGQWSSHVADQATSDFETVEEHLQSAIRLDGNSNTTLVARRLLVEIYLLVGRLEDAREQMQEYPGYTPEDRVKLAGIFYDLGNKERAASEASAALPDFLQRIEDGSREPSDFHNLAQAHLLAGEYEKALEVLSRGTHLPGVEVDFRRQLARAYLFWSNQLPEDDLSGRLQLLESAIDAFPLDGDVMTAVFSLMLGSDESDDAETQQRILETLADGGSPMLAHTIIGTRAALRGDAELAQFHLDQALEHGPESPVVLNNLAFILAFGSQHDYETALSLVDRALEQSDLPAIHETRGQILARLERWPEAITSLEAALPAMPDYAPLRQTLAEAYEAVGQHELADIHRRRLDELGGPVTLDLPPAESTNPVSSEAPLDSPSQSEASDEADQSQSSPSLSPDSP